MKKLSIDEIATAVGGRVVNSEEVFVSSVTMDSRLVEQGSLFVAIKGERVDGHSFMKSVFEKGASACLCDHIPEDVTCGVCIVVDNTVKALQDLAEFYRKLLGLKVVGISGSVGKTSTKEIVASVLAQKYNVLKTKGNYNNEIGLPLTVLSLEESHEVAVLEMGISDFGEMRVLAKVARPDVCVLTNIGQAHLEALESRDGILKAKTEMFEYMNPGAAIFVCGDDDKLATVDNRECSKLVRYGFGESNDIYASNVRTNNLYGSTFTLCFRDRKLDAGLHIIGEHMVLNAAVAAAIGEYMGLTDAEIVKGLEEARTIKGRCYLIKHGEGYIIDDCYNASPASMKQAINILALGEGTRILVLGDMLELGEETVSMHYEIGRHAAGFDFDKAILVGELARNIMQGITDTGDNRIKEVIYLNDTDELVARIRELVPDNANVMFKASNGMHFGKAIGELIGEDY